MTPKQKARQDKHHRENGRYAKVNPCYRCGRSAGIDYCSSENTDGQDVLGNEWHDIALCLCEPCALYLSKLSPEAAWVDVTSPQYGQYPQGKA